MILTDNLKNKKNKQTIHIGEEILKQLKIQQRSIAWLAKKVNCDRSNLRKQLFLQHINTELLYQISTVLDKDFFVSFSNQLAEDKQSLINTESG